MAANKVSLFSKYELIITINQRLVSVFTICGIDLVYLGCKLDYTAWQMAIFAGVIPDSKRC